jgi:polar amino acid transport system substrate-binding protein
MRSRVVSLVALILLAAGAARGAETLPPLPEAIKAKGVARVGVKCDYPPDGYLDESGKPVGIEVEMARQVGAYAFGSAGKSELSCVTTANRIPALQGGKVDLLIATIGVTDERRQVVDFTEPYAWTSSTVMVRKDSPAKKLEDVKGMKIVFVKGAWQIPWFEQHMPGIQQMRLDGVADAMQALMQGRADAYAHDMPVQVPIAKKNKEVRILDGRYQTGFRAAAVRKGEGEWLAWLNAALRQMREENLFAEWIRKHDDPELVEDKLVLWDPRNAPPEAK